MGQKVYTALGLMSGSSLDGLDIAHCRLIWENQTLVKWELLAADTLPYSEMWQARLQALPMQNALAFAKTHTYFGYYMGALVQQFMKMHDLEKVDYIASHGHTIFHDPSRRYTVQIGHGAALAATTQQCVISDFRMQDVALNGEGAPLAPLADAYLFEGYDFYLNLGGIANLSATKNKKWIAFDVVPANQLLNALAHEMGLSYDMDGQLAAAGTVDEPLLAQLQNFSYYQQDYPKSMANEWIREQVLPLLLESELPIPDKLATVIALIVEELSQAIQKIRKQEQWPTNLAKLFVTGGGAFNHFLMKQLQEKLALQALEVILPKKEIIEFKESLLMALLGLLRLEEVPNSWPAITGADAPTVNGGIYLG